MQTLTGALALFTLAVSRALVVFQSAGSNAALTQ